MFSAFLYHMSHYKTKNTYFLFSENMHDLENVFFSSFIFVLVSLTLNIYDYIHKGIDYVY